MVNKWFALASVSALSALVAAAATTAGCSSTEVQNVPFDAGHDSALADRHIGDNEEPPVVTCMVQTILDATQLPYKPAAVQKGACTEHAIGTINDFVAANPNGASFTDVKKEIAAKESQACADCVLALDDDTKTTWAPFVLNADGTAISNTGGCFEVLSGSTACGKTWFQLDKCQNTACKACTTAADQDACFGDSIAAGAACGNAADAVRSACGSNLATYIKTCYPDSAKLDNEGSIRAQCITGGSGVVDSGVADTGAHD
jgi:hypothetical protein